MSISSCYHELCRLRLPRQTFNTRKLTKSKKKPGRILRKFRKKFWFIKPEVLLVTDSCKRKFEVSEQINPNAFFNFFLWNRKWFRRNILSRTRCRSKTYSKKVRRKKKFEKPGKWRVKSRERQPVDTKRERITLFEWEKKEKRSTLIIRGKSFGKWLVRFYGKNDSYLSEGFGSERCVTQFYRFFGFYIQFHLFRSIVDFVFMWI